MTVLSERKQDIATSSLMAHTWKASYITAVKFKTPGWVKDWWWSCMGNTVEAQWFSLKEFGGTEHSYSLWAKQVLHTKRGPTQKLRLCHLIFD